MKSVDVENLPLHTNRVTAIQKAKRQKGSQKSLKALESGNIQEVIDSLTGLQKRYCEEYLVDLNGSAAVLRAGYNTKHPNRIAFQLMENPAIRLAIDALRAERSKGTDVTKDFVLRGITKAIELAEEAGNLNALLRGHELLARHLGMFIERTEISGPDGEAIRMEQKVRQDVADFKGRLARLAATTGAGTVSQLPDRDGDAAA
jgi:phage terminase small subunit